MKSLATRSSTTASFLPFQITLPARQTRALFCSDVRVHPFDVADRSTGFQPTDISECRHPPDGGFGRGNSCHRTEAWGVRPNAGAPSGLARRRQTDVRSADACRRRSYRKRRRSVDERRDELLDLRVRLRGGPGAGDEEGRAAPVPIVEDRSRIVGSRGDPLSDLRPVDRLRRLNDSGRVGLEYPTLSLSDGDFVQQTVTPSGVQCYSDQIPSRWVAGGIGAVEDEIIRDRVWNGEGGTLRPALLVPVSIR